MAYVGTVAMHDGEGELLGSVHYFASAKQGPEQMLKRMMLDVRRIRAARRNLPIVVVKDGAPEMWNRVTEALQAEPTIHTWHEVRDRLHLNERLAETARVIAEDNDVEAREIRERWREVLDEDDDAILAIQSEISAAMTQGFIGKAYETLHDNHTYIENNHHRMRYATRRARNLPIGSGVTEAACKTVVTQRVKRSGQRWRPAGLNAVMALRTQLLNSRLDGFLDALREQDYKATVRLAA